MRERDEDFLNERSHDHYPEKESTVKNNVWIRPAIDSCLNGSKVYMFTPNFLERNVIILDLVPPRSPFLYIYLLYYYY